MTDQQETAQQPNPPAPGPWDDYLAAAQRLDAVRRAASSAAGEQQAAAAAARKDLAAHAMAGGPPAVLAALRQARATADAADATIIGSGPGAPRPPKPWRPWARNLLVYGPFAGAVLIVQIALYLVAPQGSVSTYALLCGLSLPLLAFGLGWVTIGFVYGGEGKVDRTPIVGAVACLAPVLLTCMGVGVVALFHLGG